MGWSQNTDDGDSFTFVKKEDRDGGDASNMASKFASKAMRGEISMADGQLAADFESVLKGEAIYLPEFHCGKNDFALLAGLAKDMETHELASEGGGMVNWSKHLKHENPEFSQTFARIVQAMSEYFDVDVYATRLNFYRDGTDWKPFHHDSHAYGGREKREDFTMGASFGGERELTFLHEPSGSQFSFPQRNGDVFAFTTEVNKRFKHGVPKLTRGIGGPRFSIIAWGRRGKLTSRNGGEGLAGDVRVPTPREAGSLSGSYPGPGRGQHASSSFSSHSGDEKVNELVMGSGECSELIRRYIREEEGRERARRGGRGGGRGRRVDRGEEIRRDPDPTARAGHAHGDENEGDEGQRAGGGGAAIGTRRGEVLAVEGVCSLFSEGRGGRGFVLRARQVPVRRRRGEGHGVGVAPAGRGAARGAARGARGTTRDVVIGS